MCGRFMKKTDMGLLFYRYGKRGMSTAGHKIIWCVDLSKRRANYSGVSFSR